MLTDERRKQLDGIVQKMVQNKESDSNIQFVVDDFKTKYGKEEFATQKLNTGKLGTVAGIVGGKELAVGAALSRGGESEHLLQSATQLGQNSSNLITKAKALPMGDPRRRQLLEQSLGQSTEVSNQASQVLSQLPSTRQVVGSAGKLALTAGTLGSRIPATAGKRIAQSAATGAGFGGAEGLTQNKGVGGVAKSALAGGAVGGVVAGGIEAVRAATKAVPKLLSYTAETPEEVLKRNYQRPNELSQSLKDLKEMGQVGLKNKIQGASRELRATLSKEWDEGQKIVVEQNLGRRLGLNQAEQRALKQIAKDYHIDLPGNMNNMSAKEFLDVNKSLNELYSLKEVKEKASGILVRKSKAFIEDYLNQFPGAKQFLKNYGTEKQVFDAAEKLVKSYDANNPISQTTALTRLRTAFSENKPAYLSALQRLEEKTGIPFTDEVAQLNVLQVAPKGSRLASLIKDLAFPITSPRSAGFLSRQAGRVAQSLQQPKRGIGRKLGTQILSEQAGR